MRRVISQHTIPQALYEAGLAPADVVRPTCPPGVVWRHLPADGHLPSRYVDWESHRHLAECWYLVERYQMALIPPTAPSHQERQELQRVLPTSRGLSVGWCCTVMSRGRKKRRLSRTKGKRTMPLILDDDRLTQMAERQDPHHWPGFDPRCRACWHQGWTCPQGKAHEGEKE